MELVDMRDSKPRASRRESSSLSSGTSFTVGVDTDLKILETGSGSFPESYQE